MRRQKIKTIKGKQKNRGITLIALVITIIVLLILAGVSIATLTGENGILNQANSTKIETRGAEVQERVSLWKAEYRGNEYAGTTSDDEDAMLAKLIDANLVSEEEIDRDDKEITIGDRVIDYSIDELIRLEPDTGKEALIVEIAVEGTEEVKLDCYNCNFDVDWGDGNSTTGINNSNIDASGKHAYASTGTYEIKITGETKSFNGVKSNTSNNSVLKKVKQWGTVGLETISMRDSTLEEMVSPTQNSFINLEHANFENCKELTRLPDNLFANCPNLTYFYYTFKDCSNLVHIPGNLFGSSPYQISRIEWIFQRCTSLTKIPKNLFANCYNVRSFRGVFDGCSGIKEIPEKLFENCQDVSNFKYTFSGCSGLISAAPELWLRVQYGEENGYDGDPDGSGCFSGCTNLSNYDEIPSYWTIMLDE